MPVGGAAGSRAANSRYASYERAGRSQQPEGGVQDSINREVIYCMYEIIGCEYDVNIGREDST